MAAHRHALLLVRHWEGSRKKAPMLMQQKLRMRLGVPPLTSTGATKCNRRPNGNYGGGRRFDRAMDCNKDEDETSPVGCALLTSHCMEFCAGAGSSV